MLDFEDDSFNFKNDDSYVDRIRSFAVLVNSVLSLLHNRRAIRKMRLDCAHSLVNDKSRADSVNTWVRAVIGPHLEELHLDLHSYNDGPAFKLPLSLFTCPNLVSLRHASIVYYYFVLCCSLLFEINVSESDLLSILSILGRIRVNLQSSTPISLPSLKILLINTGFIDIPSINALLRGCPSIETLDLSFYDDERMGKIYTPPTLKRLDFYADSDGGGPSLEINTSRLEYLNITQCPFHGVLNTHNLHNVVEASLDLYPMAASLDLYPMAFGFIVPLLKLLDALSRTKHLTLSGSTTKWLLGEPRELLFQEYRYLLRLELMLPCVNSNSLLCLLQKCPVLQVLKIQIYEEEQPPILGWAPLPSVPTCLISHLTVVQFKGFHGFPDEMSFAEHVLQKGLVLKTLIFSDIFLDQSEKYDILKRLSNVSRASGMCQLTFD